MGPDRILVDALNPDKSGKGLRTPSLPLEHGFRHPSNSPRATRCREYQLLSDTAEYALRAVLYIAQHDVDGPVRAKVVADSLDVPRNYLSKTLHRLAREGILTSTRGGTGGFRLAHDPAELRLVSIVAPFEEIDPARTCILGRPECSEGDPCRAHKAWREITDRKSAFLRGTTVADLIGAPEESEGEGATP